MQSETEFAKVVIRKIAEISKTTGMTRKQVVQAAIEMIEEEQRKKREAEELIIP